LHDFLCIALPKIAGGALVFGLNLVLLSYFGVEQYGVYGLCMAGILLADAVLGGAFDLAVLRFGQASTAADARDDSTAIERAALRLKLGAAAALGIALIAFSWWSSSSHDAWHLVALSCLVVLAMLALRSVLVHLQLRQRFIVYGAIDLLHIGAKFGAIAILLAVTSPGVPWLLILLATGPLMAALVGAGIAGRHLFDLQAVPWRRYRDLLDLTKWYLATVALGAFIGRADILALGLLGTLGQAGTFSSGQVIASIPELLGNYLAVVLTPRIIPYARSGELRRLFTMVQVALLVAGLVGYGLALVIWADTMPMVLPPRHLPAAQIALILLPGTLAAMITVPLALPIVMLWRKTMILRMDCIVAPVLLIAYAIVIPRHGASGAAWVTCAGCLVRSAIVQFVAWRCVTAHAPP